MAGPGLSTSRAAGQSGHLGDTNTVHQYVNKLDTTVLTASATGVLEYDNTVGTVKVSPTSVAALDARLDALETVIHNTQTGTAYTAVSGDAGKIIEMNNASSNTLTFGSMTTGTIIGIRQYGAGTTTVAASGITIRSRGGLVNLAGQYAEATITYRTSTEAVLSGDLV